MSRKIDVFFEGGDRAVGRLTGDDNGALSFAYTAAADRPISLSLPLEKEHFGDIAARGFFGNLLQENASLDAVIDKHRLDRSDIAGLLAHLGRDCPGAISCVPEGEAPGKAPGRLDADYDRVESDELAVIARSLRDQRRMPDASRNPSPLAGVQGKIALATLPDGSFGLPRPETGAPTTHILKIPRAGEEHLVMQEHRLMMLADEVQPLGAATTSCIQIEDVHGLLITRFDRDVENGVVRRVHQEDFCQALGLGKSLKYERDGTDKNRFDAGAIGTMLGDLRTPGVARQCVFKATILNIALGNTDNHGKNHALLYRGKLPDLAPLYDIVPVLLDPKVNHDLSFRVGKATNCEELTSEDLRSLAGQLGLRVRGRALEVAVARMARDVLEPVSQALRNFSGPSGKLMGDMIAHQLNLLNDALGLDLDIEQRDAFFLKGGGFQTES
jgi:serine/threonine-protein kinase HipA